MLCGTRTMPTVKPAMRSPVAHPRSEERDDVNNVVYLSLGKNALYRVIHLKKGKSVIT